MPFFIRYTSKNLGYRGSAALVDNILQNVATSALSCLCTQVAVRLPQTQLSPVELPAADHTPPHRPPVDCYQSVSAPPLAILVIGEQLCRFRHAKPLLSSYTYSSSVAPIDTTLQNLVTSGFSCPCSQVRVRRSHTPQATVELLAADETPPHWPPSHCHQSINGRP